MTVTAESFKALYGYPPQEYFDRVVRGDASGWRIPGFEAKIAAWQKELDALAAAPSGLEKLYKQAELETEITNYRGLVAADKAHQRAAKAFLTGEIDDYGPFLGNQGQMLAEAGLIVTTAVPA